MHSQFSLVHFISISLSLPSTELKIISKITQYHFLPLSLYIYTEGRENPHLPITTEVVEEGKDYVKTLLKKYKGGYRNYCFSIYKIDVWMDLAE